MSNLTTNDNANSVASNYEDGLCPDCGETIADDVTDGDECQNCGHVFWSINASDDQ